MLKNNVQQWTDNLKERCVMGFLTAFLYYACLFVVLVLVAVAGVFVGKKLRDRKDAKKSKEAESEITIEE